MVKKNMGMAKYLLVGLVFIFGIYIYPYVDELGVVISVAICACFILFDIRTYLEKVDDNNKDIGLRESLHIVFSAPKYAPEGKKVFIEFIKKDEYRVYTKKGDYSIVIERGEEDAILNMKKEKLSDVDFFKEVF
ncbi:hypothetical protein [Bacillus cereus group sp. BfR-BA-02730]|uniref:hypothetical protein n=1 Tax=Bacillus cereus group sp. BfR-BA-02730 TaxID=3094893 RepID=UPI0029C4CB7A|nr:hypothetical protein [Bacillus cereus group sp. BfR-BA-02730]MDX5808443.1 hypothetical protein [Bacillus cereus group sp. BfR-BA-02730]